MLVTDSFNSTPSFRLPKPTSGATAEKSVGESGADIQKKSKVGAEQFTPDQLREIADLKSRDREVRMHEQAHLSTAGSYASSGMKFEYVTGPDGQRYATGGEVSIDVSEIPNDPEASLRKAETIRRAALAPASPSGQDRSIAAKASAMANKALADLLLLQQRPDDNSKHIDVRA